LSVPEFVAGFVYGITGDMKLTEIEACYAGGKSLEPYIHDMLYDLRKFKIFGAIMNLEKFIFHLKETFLVPCSDMQDDLKKIEAFYAIFLDPEALGEALAYNYLEHRTEFKADV